jgi:hypothetical protein
VEGSAKTSRLGGEDRGGRRIINVMDEKRNLKQEGSCFAINARRVDPAGDRGV